MEEPRLKLIDPLRETVRFVQVTLFEQFHWNKWFIWGMLAFIGANLGTGMLSFPGAPGETSGGSSGGSGPDWTLPDLQAWINQNLDLALAILAAGAVALLVISILLMVWLYIVCRGRFMFLESVFENHTRVSDAWSHNGPQALSLFWWFNAYYSVLFLVVVLAFGGGVMILYQEDGGWRAPADAWPELLALALGFCLLLLAFSVVALYLEDFIVPLMWSHRLGIMDAWRAFGRLFHDQAGPFLLYVPLRLGLTLAASVVLLLGTCLTCCLAVLPVIGQTLFLPLYVGMRMYPVLILAQLDPSLRPRLETPPAAATNEPPASGTSPDHPVEQDPPDTEPRAEGGPESAGGFPKNV